MELADILPLDRRALGAMLENGHPVDPEALAEWEYRGIAVGSKLVERFAWKTFKKVFHRDAEGGHLRGWNIRIQQAGVDGPFEPILKHGRPWTWGYYRVTSAAEAAMPWAAQHGLLIDYGFGENGRWSPQGLMKDPLLAIHKGDPTMLIGVTYVDLGWFQLKTPTYFILVRDCPLREVVPSRASQG